MIQADIEFDRRQARIDLGQECPKCGLQGDARRATYLGLPTFECARCGAFWCDLARESKGIAA